MIIATYYYSVFLSASVNAPPAQIICIMDVIFQLKINIMCLITIPRPKHNEMLLFQPCHYNNKLRNRGQLEATINKGSLSAASCSLLDIKFNTVCIMNYYSSRLTSTISCLPQHIYCNFPMFINAKLSGNEESLGVSANYLYTSYSYSFLTLILHSF